MISGRLSLAAFALTLVVAQASPLATLGAVPARPSTGCASSSPVTGRRLERSIDVDGVPRTYILDAPDSVRAGAPAPLLLDFHGFSHSAEGVWRVSKFRDLAAGERFLTAYLDGLPVRFSHKGNDFRGAGWEIANEPRNRDLRFISALLDRLEREYCIDRARIFATGFSNGGYFSHLLGCTMADRIAAIAPVGGGRRPAPCAPARAVPVLIHHGRRDDIIDVADARAARDSWVESDACRGVEPGTCERHTGCRDGSVVEYCEDDSAHHWPQAATNRIWEFFRAHPMTEGFEGSRAQGAEGSDPKPAQPDSSLPQGSLKPANR